MLLLWKCVLAMHIKFSGVSISKFYETIASSSPESCDSLNFIREVKWLLGEVANSRAAASKEFSLNKHSARRVCTLKE